MLGLSVYYQTTVGDNEERLAEVIKTALNRSDIVILNGGLGPTEDDLTKETCAKVMGLPLVTDQHTEERLKEYYKGRKKRGSAGEQLEAGGNSRESCCI